MLLNEQSVPHTPRSNATFSGGVLSLGDGRRTVAPHTIVGGQRPLWSCVYSPIDRIINS